MDEKIKKIVSDIERLEDDLRARQRRLSDWPKWVSEQIATEMTRHSRVGGLILTAPGVAASYRYPAVSSQATVGWLFGKTMTTVKRIAAPIKCGKPTSKVLTIEEAAGLFDPELAARWRERRCQRALRPLRREGLQAPEQGAWGITRRWRNLALLSLSSESKVEWGLATRAGFFQLNRPPAEFTLSACLECLSMVAPGTADDWRKWLVTPPSSEELEVARIADALRSLKISTK